MTKVKNKKPRLVRRKQLRKESEAFEGMIPEATINKVAKAQWPLFKELIPEIEDYIEISQLTCDYYNHLIKHRGVLEGTKRFKSVRTYILKWVLGYTDIEPIPCLSLCKDGFPRDLMHLKMHSIKGNLNIKMVYTILNISRLSVHRGKLNKSTLTSIYRNIQRDDAFKSTINEFARDLPKIFKKLKIEKVEPQTYFCNKINFISSGANGPNSRITKRDMLLSAPEDAKAVVSDVTLSRNIKTLLTSYGVPELWDYIEELAKAVPDEMENPGKLIHSKIALIPDSENKQRIVAIVDYWTQLTLIPIENLINKVIRKVPNNYMFDQDKGRDKARRFTITGKPFSLDGKDFTDRFPKELQLEVLSQLVGPITAKAVMDTLVKRKFYVNDNLSISYEVGQPMGAHCSFHLANLTHSVFAIWCAMKAQPKTKYLHSSAVCGDDIVFKNDKSAILYEEKMKSLKMTFSSFKGFKSNSYTKVAEFCKKLYLKGSLVSGITPKPFLNYMRDYKYAFSCIDTVGMDDEEALQWVRLTRNNDLKEISNIKIAKMISDGKSELLKTTPFYHTMCPNLQLKLDDMLEELGETLFTHRMNMVTIIAMHQLKVNEKFSLMTKFPLVKTMDTIERCVKVTDAPINPISKQLMFEGDLVKCQKNVSDVITNSFVTVYNKESEDGKSLPTPAAFWWLEIDDPAKGHPLYGPLKKIGIKDQSIEATGYYTSSSGCFNQLREEIKISIFTGLQTTSLALNLRLDDRNLMERDKKQFLISKRIIKIINDLYYSENSNKYIGKCLFNSMMKT